MMYRFVPACLIAAMCIASLAMAQSSATVAVGASSSPGLGITASAPQVSAVGAARSALTGTGPTAAPEDIARIHIAPGFLLNISVFDEPDMTVDLPVDASGNIALPLTGTIHVGGDTLGEARQAIEADLISQQILRHPQVTVNIDQYAPYIVTVLGEVQSQGRIQLLVPHSLLDVLSLVGGETQLAGGEILLRHMVDGVAKSDIYKYARTGDGSSIAHVMVHDGDTVTVPRAGIVYVLGAVTRPGGYVMQENGKLDVAQALSLAMGTTLQAKVGTIRVLRRNADGTWFEIPVSYSAIARGKQIPLPLQAQDIVYVPVSKPKAILTSGASIIGETGSAAIYLVR